MACAYRHKNLVSYRDFISCTKLLGKLNHFSEGYFTHLANY